MRTAALWFIAGVGTWIILLAALDFVEQWVERRRPVRDSSGRWRMP